MQDERLREDAKQLLRTAYERQVASGDVGLGVDLRAAAEERGMDHDSPYLAALVDYMEVAGWIEQDPGADLIGRGEMGMPVRRVTERARKCCTRLLTRPILYSIQERASLSTATPLVLDSMLRIRPSGFPLVWWDYPCRFLHLDFRELTF